MLCYIVGLTNLPLRSWLIISTIAPIPSIITSTIGGSALGMGRYTFAAAVFGATLTQQEPRPPSHQCPDKAQQRALQSAEGVARGDLQGFPGDAKLE